ncbi:MAG TPA: TfuA-like protein [Polyangiaceae bacterium]|nr:TfuA-like protein [Polyangiaceae bacterium]
MSQEIHVFVGPSLPPSERPSMPGLIFHPPVAQGDVYQLVQQRPLALAIIDGYFERVPSVWHKEILWALSEGVRVFGAASMGALRAAELADFGMVGVGSIFEDFASGRLSDDDEVAIVHADASFDFRAASEAMVNIRATLALAEQHGVLSATQQRALVAHTKRLFYPDRTYAALLACTREQLDGSSRDRFEVWLRAPDHRVDQKKLDALVLLKGLADLRSAAPPTERLPWTFQHTDAWEQVRLALVRKQAARSEGSVAAQHLSSKPEHTAAASEVLVDRARLRALEIVAAKRDGFTPTRDDVQQAIAEYCRRCGFTKAEQLGESLVNRGISPAAFEILMLEQACVARSRRVPAYDLQRAIADLLRLEGRTAVIEQASAAE